MMPLSQKQQPLGITPYGSPPSPTGELPMKLEGCEMQGFVMYDPGEGVLFHYGSISVSCVIVIACQLLLLFCHVCMYEKLKSPTVKLHCNY